MKKRHVLMAVAMCLTLIFSSVVSSFAAAVATEPFDKHNPKITITHTRSLADEQAGKDGELSIESGDFESGKLYVGEESYDIGETYSTKDIIRVKWNASGEADRLEADDTVYALHLISSTTPGTYLEPPKDLILEYKDTYECVQVEKFSNLNPILSVSYKDKDTLLSLSVASADKDLERGVLDLGDQAFPITGESKVNGKLTDAQLKAATVSTGERLFTLSLINKAALVDDPNNIDTVLKYELIPSTETPQDMVETVNHRNTDTVFEDIYYINGEQAEKKDYDKTFKKFKCSERLDKTEKTVESEPMTEAMSFEGKDAQHVNQWVIDRYFHYTKTVTTKHNIYVLARKADEIFPNLDDSNWSKASYLPLKARQHKVGYSEVELRWSKIKDAEEYIVYRSKCGLPSNYKKIGEVKDTFFTARKLKKGTYYKYIVVAVDRKGKILTASPAVHIATKGGYKNPRDISVKLKKKGKTTYLNVKANNRGVDVHKGIRFASSDKKIATVNRNGRIKAKKKGTCYIYVYAQNGLYKKVKVTIS